IVGYMFKVLDDHAGKARCLCLSGYLVGQSLTGVKERAVDARHSDWNREPEIRILAELDVLQRTVQGCRQKRARYRDRHTLANAVSAAGPAGVDQPAIDIVL